MKIKDSPNRHSAQIRLATLILAAGIAVFAASCSSTPPPTEMSTASTLSPSSNPTAVVQSTDPILGDVSHLDPIAIYPDIAKYAGENLRLSSADFYFVR